MRSLTIADLIHNKAIYAASTTGLGEYYMNRDSVSLDSAIYFTVRSLAANKGTVDEPYTTNLLGQIYQKQKRYDEAIEMYKLAYELSVKFESQYDLAISNMRLAQAYRDKGDLKLALQTYNGAEKAAMDSKSNYLIKEIYEDVAAINGKLHDYSNAFKYQYLLTGIKDTIYGIEKDKALEGIRFINTFAYKNFKLDLEKKKLEIQNEKRIKNTFGGGLAVALLIAGVFFIQRKKISKEKKRSESLLLNILPSIIADELKKTGSAEAKQFNEVTVMFTDFKDFTKISEKLTPSELVAEIHNCFKAFDGIIGKYNIEKIKTMGDSYMCAGGLPVHNTNNAIDIINAAKEIQQFMIEHAKLRKNEGKEIFEIRIGINSGPVVAGIVGVKKFAYDIWGDTVNLAARMEQSSEAGKINVSGFTYELIKDKFNCTYRGKIEAKNKGEIDMYFVD